MSIPQAPEAERSVLGQALNDTALIGTLSSLGLTGRDFYDGAGALLWDYLVETYYADEAIDPVTVGGALGPKLARAWQVEPTQVVAHLQTLAAGSPVDGKATDHATVIRRQADRRKLLALAVKIKAAVEAGEVLPEEVAGQATQDAMKIATGAQTAAEVVTFADQGRALIAHVQRAQAAQRAGIQIGVRTKITAIDTFTKGIQPGELVMSAGEAGVGKSGVWWRAGLNFAELQAERPDDKHIGTLVLSMEMGKVPSGMRVAQMIAQTDTAKVRSGEISDYEMNRLITAWRKRKDLPLYFNFLQYPRASQIRAVVAEAIRRHNVGFVILDHFKTFRLDERLKSSVEEDEEKVIFLKYQLALEMDVAVVCLAHTRKTEDPNGRPKLADLRGSQQIVAHADFVNFLYRPYKYASQADIDNQRVLRTDAEFLWEKARFGEDGATSFYFDPATMYAK